MTVVYPTLNGTHTPLWLAVALNYFSERHVNVDAQYIESNVATKAFAAKQIDVLLQAAAPFITANLNGGLDMVYVASEYNHSQFSLNVAPSIRSAADLKGRPVATDKPGTTNDFATRLLLSLVGVQPSDVELRSLGSGNTIFAALQSGQIVAGQLSPPLCFQAEAAGFHSIANSYKIPYQSVGVAIRRSRLDELTPALLPFLEGYRAGIRAFNAQPDAAIKLMSQYTKETDPGILQRTYDFYKTETGFQEDLQPTLEGIQSMLNFLGDPSLGNVALTAARTATPEQFVDRRLLDQLN